MARKIYSAIATMIILLTCSTHAHSQSDTTFLSHATSSLEKYSAAYPIEKVYLHLDKSSYDMGDTVWYKVYTVIGQHHRLSALSGVLYVELIGPVDTVMTRQILHLTAGVAWGDLALPDKAKPGEYHIRAYTNWMCNVGADYFYNQKIHIGGYETTPAVKAVQNKLDVQFFPEGGELVNGLRSKVAVKAVNGNGDGQDIKGSILDNEGNVVADFATQHLGMGVFALTPQSGKTYKAKITAGETDFTVSLPQAMQEGYTLGINSSNPDSLFIKVAANEQLFKEKQHSTFYITAQTAGKVYYAAKGKLEDMVFTSAVDKKRFPSGIVQFTLFSENGEPLNERSVFVQNDDTLQLDIDAAAKTYTTRQKVKLSLGAKNKDNQRAAGTFSVAVVNESMAEASEDDILSKLLLTSDLKGHIEQPGYYFTNPNEQTEADLDVLMLTQGYQRFAWKPILSNTGPVIIYPPENALELAGSISTLSGKPVPNGKVTLIAIHDNLVTDTLTDVNGNFKFTDLELPDSAKVILSAKRINNGNNVTINVKPVDYAPVIRQKRTDNTNTIIPELPATATATPNSTSVYRQQKLDMLNKKRQLKEVIIKARKVVKREKPDLDNSDNLNGPGNADQVIMADELKGCVNLQDCLTGIARGVTFINGIPRNDHYHHPHIYPPIMTLIIDGAIEPGMKIDDLNPNIIHSIEVLQSDSYLGVYGGKAAGGALVITTKRGGDKDFVNTDPVPGTLKYSFKGFYKTKEFYSPKYDNPQSNAAIPDLRSTIYWNPNIITDKDGKASFEYFNADTKGTYRVVVEGIDSDGNLGRRVYRYKVE
jgi:hypothetical protein